MWLHYTLCLIFSIVKLSHCGTWEGRPSGTGCQLFTVKLWLGMDVCSSWKYCCISSHVYLWWFDHSGARGRWKSFGGDKNIKEFLYVRVGSLEERQTKTREVKWCAEEKQTLAYTDMWVFNIRMYVNVSLSLHLFFFLFYIYISCPIGDIAITG